MASEIKDIALKYTAMVVTGVLFSATAIVGLGFFVFFTTF